MKMTFRDVPYPGWSSFVLFCLVPVAAGGIFFLLVRHRPGWFARWPAGLRLLVLNLMALGCFASTAFLVLETYYRFIYDTTDSFNYTLASKRWFERYYHRNAAELRDNVEYPDAIPAGNRRITFLGDSFTAGQGVKNVEDRFANRLRARHKDWDVQVLAVEGLDTGPEIVALKRLIDHQYKMDVVVLVYCLNDVADMMPEWSAALDRIFSDWEKRSWLVMNSYFADTYYFRLKARLDPNIPNYFSLVRNAYQGPLWETQKQRLATLRAMVESQGGQLLVVTFPFLHVMGPNYEYEDIHNQLGKLWGDLGVPHLDLAPVFKNYPAGKLVINQLDAHPNEFAHAVAAEAIDTFIQAELKQSPTNRP